MIQVIGRPLRGLLSSLPKPRRPEPRTAEPWPLLLALQADGPGMTQIGPCSGPNALLTGAIVLESKPDPAVTCIQPSMAPQWPQDRVQTSSLPLKTLGAKWPPPPCSLGCQEQEPPLCPSGHSSVDRHHLHEACRFPNSMLAPVNDPVA